MKKLLFLFSLLFLSKSFAQILNGEVFLRDNSELYLNQVYVTNLVTQKTVLSDYNGDFKIEANLGDAIRFTSIITDRKHITVTKEMLGNTVNFYELKIAYHDIQEVVLSHFKPTGNLRKDISQLKSAEKNLAIQKMIGLPAPKGNGTSPELPVASFTGGGLTFSLDSIFDLLSGERKKKERYYEYQTMNNSVSNIKKYFGEDYFLKLKIPKNLIDNFLQFVYSSDNLKPYLAQNNYEATQVYIERYLPVYLKRLRNSNLQSITGV